VNDVAILRTGAPPAGLAERFGRYEDMFERLLGRRSARVYDVEAGELPERADSHGAFLITGSPAGVYEPLPWIAPLLSFIRSAKGKAKLVGVCFGHQAMAEALGGKVEKSERGWGVGLHDYEVRERATWMGDDVPSRISIPVSHQDQVVAPPPGARVLGGSPFSPFGMLEWEGGDALSMQFHPEFEPAYAAALIKRRRDLLPEPDAAIASLSRSDDRALVARWIRAFLDDGVSPSST
jgi:GMP synthase-like glutamine amidotransferase